MLAGQHGDLSGAESSDAREAIALWNRTKQEAAEKLSMSPLAVREWLHTPVSMPVSPSIASGRSQQPPQVSRTNSGVHGGLTLNQAIDMVKSELGIATSLTGRAAVEHAAKELSIDATDKAMRQLVIQVCSELGIETGWKDVTNPTAISPKRTTSNASGLVNKPSPASAAISQLLTSNASEPPPPNCSDVRDL
eukprot:SAG11_NODE_6327_length_1335_cov_3.942557_1_plen_193_part_00